MSRKANRVGTTVQRYWPAIAALLFAFSFIVPLAFSGVARWRYNAALGASSRPSPWTRFTSPSGDFTVLLPEVAAETTQTVQHAEGPTTLRSVAAVAGPGAGYSVMVGEAPDDGENVTVRLDRLGADFVQRSKGKLLAQSVVSAGSVVGREIRIASAEHSLRARLFVVNRHVYQVLVIRPPAADEDVLDERFLDSFTLP